jgi:hypothetical protein
VISGVGEPLYSYILLVCFSLNLVSLIVVTTRSPLKGFMRWLHFYQVLL